MPAASRHAKPKTPAPRLRALAVAATALAGVVAAFVVFQGGSAVPRTALEAIPATSPQPAAANYNIIAAIHRGIAASTAARPASLVALTPSVAARRRHLAALRLARMLARRQAAAQSPTPNPAPAPPPPTRRRPPHPA